MSIPLIDIGSTVAIMGLVISVLTLYLNQRKTKKEIELAKQYIQILSGLVESYEKRMNSHERLEKDKLEWDKLKTIGKALGWVVDYLEGE